VTKRSSRTPRRARAGGTSSQHQIAAADATVRYMESSALVVALLERDTAKLRKIPRGFIVDVDRAVLDRVRRPFPVEPIRTLDAIHLATVELLGEAPQLITVVTRDERVGENARALGFAVE
jgi:hypothetical protein